MAKRVFFSFHYQDVIDFRANVVRNHWVSKPDREQAGYFDKSIWEDAKKTNKIGLKRLINGAFYGTSTTCVLIGSETYARPWVRYEIIKSLCRGNKVFAVHINQIKGKDQKTKINGPNPFDYIALRYSKDGKRVEIFEFLDGKWGTYQDHDSYLLKSIAHETKRGKSFTLSELNCKTYCWLANDGYKNFANWVGY